MMYMLVTAQSRTDSYHYLLFLVGNTPADIETLNTYAYDYKGCTWYLVVAI